MSWTNWMIMIDALFHKKNNSVVYNADCLVGMKEYFDNYFDLAIVDPPYGINIVNKTKNFSAKLFTDGNNWDDSIPDESYFSELFRISKNQIIWGANYFLDYLGKTKCMIIWDKYNTNKGRFADGEIAWTSFDKPTRIATYEWLRWYQPNMKNKQIRIHPTQKPLELYDWLLSEYSHKEDVILDTHVGSQSSRISAYKLGRDFVGFEIDEKYFADGNKRFLNYSSQQKLQF